MKQRILAIASALLLAVTFAVATPADPATAASGDCPNGRLCMWPHINYQGSIWVWDINTISQQPNGCLTFTASAQNTFSSLYARVGIVGSTVVKVWAGSGCTGYSVRIYSNTIDPNLDQGNPIIGMHDTMESVSVTN